MMKLYKEILASILSKEQIEVNFPNLRHSAAELAELVSFNALQKIKTIVEDDSLSDFECVEKIVRVLEETGTGSGGRHDFG